MIDAVALQQPPAAVRPAIHWDAIPYDARRKADMRAYAIRHYGIRTARLRAPKVVVEHLTANSSYRATWNTFAPNRPDPELGERPGTCAHFVIDPAGRIHQLVPLGLMCRHTVGLNWTAIGIEHVGTSEAAVMGNRRMLRASQALTRWLQARFSIRTRDVIGHRESRSSPYHRERVARLRTQTHADFPASVMRRYRAGL
ncbi:peptidoglycan recognition family protein [Conexibacter sp. SYSU D00693]|uniref:peptidoglycan recognition protein family protein n=1 Tax=Conexibacter sp. SYSU D00693 TaxID=2812560 RepID=UPI00196ABFBC|nr:peptidoglycan recognition family protein [Conexibacter sp. SYSU D00693]